MKANSKLENRNYSRQFGSHLGNPGYCRAGGGLSTMGVFVVPATLGGATADACGPGAFEATKPGTCGATVDGRPSRTELGAEPTEGDGGMAVDGRSSGTALDAEPSEADGMAGIGPSVSLIVGEGASGEAAGTGSSASLMTGDGCAAGVVAAGGSATLLDFDVSAGGAGGIGAAFEAVDAGDAPAIAEAFRVPSTVISILPLLVFTTTL